MTKSTFRRVVAYILDIIIVSIIASGLASIRFLNPRLTKYEETYDAFTEYITEALEDTTKLQEMQNSKEYLSYSYDIAYYGMYASIITIVISFLYFVVFQYYTDGQTGGKKLLGIKIISKDEKNEKLTIKQLIIRGLIINSLLTSTLTVIVLASVSEKSYFNYQQYIELFEIAMVFESIGFALYRQDGRGLHDLASKTMVVKVSELEEIKEEEKEESKKVKDVEFKEVKPKKTTKKGTKK